MKRIFKLTLASVIGACFALPVLSDPKPRGSKPVDPQAIIQNHLGKTWNWSEGASYWGSGGTFQAVWKGRSVADGRWYVTSRGTLCYDAIWSFREDDGSVGASDIKRCWKHVVDKEGQIWQRHHEKEDWYRWNSEKVISGNKLQAEHRQILAKLK